MKFWDKLKEQFEEDKKKQTDKHNLKLNKIEKMDSKGNAYCPKCFSESVEPFKNGFSLGKSVVGGVLLGPLGLMGGLVGKNKVKMHCLKCKHVF